MAALFFADKRQLGSDQDDDDSSDDSEYVPDEKELDDEDDVDDEDDDDVEENPNEEAGLNGGGDNSSNKKQQTTKKSKSRAKKELPGRINRFRRGGIRLEGEAEDEAPAKPAPSSSLTTAGLAEPAADAADEREKRRADALWASFLADVQPAKPASSSVAKTADTVAKATDTVAKATDTVAKATDTVFKATDTVAKTTDTVAKATDTVAKVTDTVAKATDTVAKVTESVAKTTNSVTKATTDASKSATATQATKIFEFAGESVAVPIASPSSGCSTKRPAAAAPKGVTSLLDRLTKRPKLSTLEKSRLDWESFKSSEGIGEDLAAYNRGKAGYLDRQAFLERADYRRYEQERDARLASGRGGQQGGAKS
ncbi:hypothetical protein BOX15_Mlig029546g1 [Macrostomum lignano]|uniref:Craniofacial development protein 1 n=1 Tax=Macrostomum lignano TaxID=282301 RepID=A0A267GZ02_9PLAT|nr:hypothetical protein BOX15_Mlig029546g1 [Macrostomum lignano]